MLQRTPTRDTAYTVRLWAAALATVTLVVALRLYQLDTLQSEIYGDIAVVREYVQRILNGGWPNYFDTSSGPLYHYLIVPLALLTRSSYFGFKLASVLTSFGVLAFTYLLSRRLVKESGFALLATTIAGASSWLLIFSRLGNSQIIVPLLATASLWFTVRAAQTGGPWNYAASALIASLGLYGYPQSFILPGTMLTVLICLRLTGHPIRWRDLGLFVLVTFFSALPFLWIALQQGSILNGNDYVTGKLQTENPLGALLNNLVNASLAFHWQGDSNIRSNPLSLPHLDWISGALFIGGIIFWLRRDRRRQSPALFVPFILLQVPSILVLNVAVEVPSASRTLGAAPLAYIFVASGLWWLAGWLAEKLVGRWRRASWMVGGVVLIGILGLNLNRYFNQYLNNLPYQNTPVGRLVREYVDTLPPETHIYLIGCCWEFGMPEPPSIEYEMAHPEKFHYLENTADLMCDQVAFFHRPAVLIWSDKEEAPAPLLSACAAWFRAQSFVSPKGLPIFRAAPLQLDPASGPPNDEEALIYEPAQLNGQRIGVRHSPFDIGLVQDLFDGDPNSLVRGARDNPLVLELRFPQLQEARSVSVQVGTMPHFMVKAALTYADGAVVSIVQDYLDLPPDPMVTLDVPSPGPIRIARIEVTTFDPPFFGAYNVHVREIVIR
jgi:hypothetical protein